MPFAKRILRPNKKLSNISVSGVNSMNVIKPNQIEFFESKPRPRNWYVYKTPNGLRFLGYYHSRTARPKVSHVQLEGQANFVRIKHTMYCANIPPKPPNEKLVKLKELK